jgi:DNA-binding MarR family transcriptional regulator
MTTLSPQEAKVKALTSFPVEEKPLGDLMREAQRTLVGYLERALHEAGHADVGAAHASVLATVDPTGTRLATLVTRGGRTKQATAELAAHLLQRGYLELDADPSDGRAKLYTTTAAGAALLTSCAEIVVGYEAWLDAVLGPRGIERLRAALLAIVDHGTAGSTAATQSRSGLT